MKKIIKHSLAILLIATQAMAQDSTMQKAMQDPTTKSIRWDLIYKTLDKKMSTKTRSGSLDFNEVGPYNIAGKVNSMAFDGVNTYCSTDNGGIWKNSNVLNNASWQNSTKNTIGDYYNFNSLNVYKTSTTTTIYAATGSNFGTHYGNSFRKMSNGIYQSTDLGNSWSVIPITQPINNNGVTDFINKIAVAKNGDIWISTAASSIASNCGIYMYRPSTGALTPISSSSNFGQGYDIEIAKNGDVWIAFKRYVPIIGLRNYIQRYRLNSITGSWDLQSQSTPSLVGIQRIEIALPSSSENIVYALCINSTSASSFTLKTANAAISNSSSTWIQKTLPSTFFNQQINENLSLIIDPNDITYNTAIIASKNIYKTTDGMDNWSSISTSSTLHDDVANVYYYPNNSTFVFACTDGGAYFSNNTNTVSPIWASINKNLNNNEFYSCATSPNGTDMNFIAGAQDNGMVLVEANKGQQNGNIITGGDGYNAFMGKYNLGYCTMIGSSNGSPHDYYSNRYPFNLSNTILFNFTNGIYSTTNSYSGGSASTSLVPTDFNDDEKILISSNGMLGVRIFRNLGVGYSTLGLPYQDFIIPQTTGSYIDYIKVSPSNPKVFYLCLDNGNILKCTWSRNGTLLSDQLNTSLTVTALPLNGNGGLPISSLDIRGTNDAEMVYTSLATGVSTQNVWYSSDGGATVTALESQINIGNNIFSLPVWCAKFINASSNNTINAKIVIGTEIGIYYTTSINGSNTQWTPDVNSPNVRVTQLQYRSASDGLLLMSTFGRGLWTSDAFSSVNVGFNCPQGTWGNGCCPITFTSTSLGANYYAWDLKNDGTIESSGSANSSITTTDPGEYVRLTINGNYSIVQKVWDLVTLASYTCQCPISQKLQNSNNIQIYPNPVNSTLHISSDKNIDMFTLFDLSGRQISILQNFDNKDIDMQNLSTGVYIYKYTIDGEVYNGKVVKE